MARDKIEVLLSRWIETQQCRLDNMAKINARVQFKGSTFYARLIINKTHLIIQPHDERKDVFCFTESRLKGSREIGEKGLIITRRFQKSSLKIFLQSTRIRDILIRKLRTLLGDESTVSSESTGSKETSNHDQDN